MGFAAYLARKSVSGTPTPHIKKTLTIFACETRTTTSTHRSRKKTPKRVAPKSIRVVPIRVVRIPHRIPHPDRPHNPPLRTSTFLFPIWTHGDVDTWGRVYFVDTWGRVYFVHFLDILNTSPCVQNCNVNLNIYSVLCRHYCRS